MIAVVEIQYKTKTTIRTKLRTQNSMNALQVLRNLGFKWIIITLILQ